MKNNLDTIFIITLSFFIGVPCFTLIIVIFTVFGTNTTYTVYENNEILYENVTDVQNNKSSISFEIDGKRIYTNKTITLVENDN